MKKASREESKADAEVEKMRKKTEMAKLLADEEEANGGELEP